MSDSDRKYPKRVEEILRAQPMSSVPSKDEASSKGDKGTEVDIHKVGSEAYVGEFD